MSADEGKLPMAKSLQQVVGGLLFGADHPLTVEEIRTVLKAVAAAEPEEGTLKLFADASPREVRDTVLGIVRELSRLEFGFELSEINGGFRFQTQPCCGRWLRNLFKRDRPNRLSLPALETLAIVAYRQPIAKSEIESIRGVTVDHAIKSLMALHLVRIVGRSKLPGRPFLYGTTSSFLEHFGLSTLTELDEFDPTLRRAKGTACMSVPRKRKREDASALPPSQGSLFLAPGMPPQPERRGIASDDAVAPAVSGGVTEALEMEASEAEMDESIFKNKPR